MTDLDALEALAKKASIGCRGRCSGTRPSYCDECEARDDLGYSYHEVLDLVAELRAARTIIDLSRSLYDRNNPSYCNAGHYEEAFRMSFYKYDETVKDKP